MFWVDGIVKSWDLKLIGCDWKRLLKCCRGFLGFGVWCWFIVIGKERFLIWIWESLCKVGWCYWRFERGREM